MSFKEQLSRFPPEFATLMEQYKLYDFDVSLNYILDNNDLVSEFNNIEETTKKEFVGFLKTLFAFGFYSGVRFTLDPEKFEYEKEN